MDYSRLLSDRAKVIKPSGIRKFFDLAETMDDVISLGVGEPDFETPWQIRRAGINSLQQGRTFYTANRGLAALRSEIAALLDRRYGLTYDSNSEILVTVGGSEAIDNALRAFVSFGDEVLIPEPSFVCYSPLATLAGGIAIPLHTCGKDNFKLTPEVLRAAITPKTKVLILPFPNNPTGAIMTREELEEIAKVLRGTDILVISDEIYGTLTYSGKHVCFAELEGMRERTVVVDGFSKAYAMTGWRLGWAFGPRELIAPIVKIHQYAIMCAPTTAQFAAIEALRSCDDDVTHMREQYDIRRRFLVSELNEMGLTCFEPQGAFYAFPSIAATGMTSEEFAERLLNEHRVAVIPGNAFGECGEGHVRISYSYATAHLQEACIRIRTFLQAHGLHK